MKIKFNSDDDVSLNKPVKFYAITIIIKSVLTKVVNFTGKFL